MPTFDSWQYGDPMKVCMHQESGRNPSKPDEDVMYRRYIQKCSSWFRQVVDAAEIAGFEVKPVKDGAWRFMGPKISSHDGIRSTRVFDPKDEHQKKIVLGELRRCGLNVDQVFNQNQKEVKQMSKQAEPSSMRFTPAEPSEQGDTMKLIQTKLNLLSDVAGDLAGLVARLEKENEGTNQLKQMLKAALKD